MQADHDFRRAIELIKQRAPIEDVVRERVPDLKQKGNRFWACCPFHDEDTASFTVNPREGIWYCFGACATGGDAIKFLQQHDNLSFMEALEILATRTGVELPRRGGGGRGPRDGDAGHVALEHAEQLFRRELASREGRRALEYMESRGLSANAIEAFSIGYSPASGRAVCGLASGGSHGAGAAEPGIDAYERAGLVRTSDDGRHYDFFRGRLMIPIRDVKGRVVGFGGRRLGDGDPKSPKYINTSETPYFHKGRLIYALDRALDAVRRGGHLILVEGYTDVMAAHQAGLSHVGAVLGTSTTSDHAALVRRAGARRVTLVFDGDEAGRRAAYRALHGLLPLDIELEVVCLPTGSDPCDLIVKGGAQPFLAQVEGAAEWFDFVADGLVGATGSELARKVDTALELFGRVRKPVHRDSLINNLAGRLGMPVATLREQWRQLPEARQAPPERDAATRQAAPRAVAGTRTEETPGPVPARPAKVERAVIEAYKGIVGAVLLDASLVPRVRSHFEKCPSPGLKAILGAILSLWDDEDATIDAGAVMTTLLNHPVRDHVPSLVEHARRAEDPLLLLDSNLRFLTEHEHESEKRRLIRRIAELQPAAQAGDHDAEKETDALYLRLESLRTGLAQRPA